MNYQEHFMWGMLVGALITLIVMITVATLIQPDPGTFTCYHYLEGGMLCERN